MVTNISRFKGYVFGGQFFSSKEKVRSRLHEILRAYEPGHRINASDSSLLLDVLQRHPSAAEKIGCGVASFEVRIVPEWKTRGFYLIRHDGSSEDFSFRQCLSPPSPETVFKDICRQLISDQLKKVKISYFRKHQRSDGCIQCPITYEWVNWDQTHVDHIPPDTFEQILADFIAHQGIRVREVKICDLDSGIGDTFADASLRQKWQTYHLGCAKLRVVSAYANTAIIPREWKKQRNKFPKQADQLMFPGWEAIA